jgi:hypothetical protein
MRRRAAGKQTGTRLPAPLPRLADAWERKHRGVAARPVLCSRQVLTGSGRTPPVRPALARPIGMPFNPTCNPML